MRFKTAERETKKKMMQESYLEPPACHTEKGLKNLEFGIRNFRGKIKKIGVFSVFLDNKAVYSAFCSKTRYNEIHMTLITHKVMEFLFWIFTRSTE